MPTNKQAQYRAGTLEKGLEVLESLQRAHEPLRILDVVTETALDRAAVFRLLCTLESRGYIKRLPDKRYTALKRRWRPRVGYVAPLSGTSFRCDVVRGMKSAAEDADMDLILVDSQNEDPAAYLSTAEELISARVNLVILFQPLDSMAHVLADRFIAAGLPVISLETPLAGALFFGGNNYKAGILAGEALGCYARDNWKGAFDKLILLESSSSPPENRARLSGAVERLHQILGDFPESSIVHLDGLSHRQESEVACAETFRSLPARSRILISAFNDVSAIGALQAVVAAKRQNWTAIVGQNGTAESRAELLKSKSPLIASVAYFPEKYGEKLVGLATAVLHRGKLRSLSTPTTSCWIAITCRSTTRTISRSSAPGNGPCVASSRRMSSFAQSSKLFSPYVAMQAPLLGKAPLPLTMPLLIPAPVVLSFGGELARVIRSCLSSR